MAVAFDAKLTTTNGDITGNAATSFSDNTHMTVGSSAQMLLLLLIAWSTATAPTSPSFTWNSIALALISGTSGANSTAGNTAIYGLLAPASGLKTLAGSWTGARDFYAAAISLSGVDQTSLAVACPHGTTNAVTATNGTATVTVTTATNNAVVAIHSMDGTSNTTPNLTKLFRDNVATAIDGAGNYSAPSGSASVALTEAFTGAGRGSISAGVDVLAAPAGGGAKLRFNSNVDGLGASGGFFRDPLGGKSQLGWRPSLVAVKRKLIVQPRHDLRLAA